MRSIPSKSASPASCCCRSAMRSGAGKRLPVELGLSQGELAQCWAPAVPRSTSLRQARAGGGAAPEPGPDLLRPRHAGADRHRRRGLNQGGHDERRSAEARRRRQPVAITFLYYRDLPAAMRFYEEVLGLTLASTRAGARSTRSPKTASSASSTRHAAAIARIGEAGPALHQGRRCRGLGTPGSPRSGSRASDPQDQRRTRDQDLRLHDPEGYQIELQSVA